jgi:hypothetical protein
MRIVVARSALLGLLAGGFLVGSVPETRADGAVTSSCSWYRGLTSCTRQWRAIPRDPYTTEINAPKDGEAAREAEERDKKWVARCKPTTWQDHYGVTRVRYAKPGCEFGKTED